MSDMREVRLPAELCQKAEELYGQRFGSLEQFITFALRELTRDEATKTDHSEQHIIEERLKDLGYL